MGKRKNAAAAAAAAAPAPAADAADSAATRVTEVDTTTTLHAAAAAARLAPPPGARSPSLTAASATATATATTTTASMTLTRHTVTASGTVTDERFGFHVRESRLEYSHMQSDLRGFFNLLILSATLFILSHTVTAYYESKHIFEVDLLWQLLSGLSSLFPVVAAMVLYSGTAFVLQSLVVAGWLHCDSFATHAAQHTIQSGLFVYALVWQWQMHWPPVQTAAFVLEMLVLWMKMHSYLQTNRALALEREHLDAHPNGTPRPKSPDVDALAVGGPGLASNAHAPGAVQYPHNVTLANWVDYMLVPTLVYETQYPRTPRVRPGYVLEKLLACLCAVAAMYFVVANYLVPVFATAHQLPFLHAVAKLVIPMSLGYMLIFYIIFECVCQGFAELTRFADREFYYDWWNSLTFDEYARKWNKPVHEFLRRHIYTYTREKLHSKTKAMLSTFLLSSLLHELVLVAMFRFFRPYFFTLQMSQIPLIYLGSKMKSFPRFANLFFWFGLSIGPSILAIAYIREAQAMHAADAASDAAAATAATLAAAAVIV